MRAQVVTRSSLTGNNCCHNLSSLFNEPMWGTHEKRMIDEWWRVPTRALRHYRLDVRHRPLTTTMFRHFTCSCRKVDSSRRTATVPERTPVGDVIPVATGARRAGARQRAPWAPAISLAPRLLPRRLGPSYRPTHVSPVLSCLSTCRHAVSAYLTPCAALLAPPRRQPPSPTPVVSMR